MVRDPPVARDKPTDPQPRGKGKDGRSLTSSVYPTHFYYLHRHPYAMVDQIRAVTTGVSSLTVGG